MRNDAKLAWAGFVVTVIGICGVAEGPFWWIPWYILGCIVCVPSAFHWVYAAPPIETPKILIKFEEWINR